MGMPEQRVTVALPEYGVSQWHQQGHGAQPDQKRWQSQSVAPPDGEGQPAVPPDG